MKKRVVWMDVMRLVAAFLVIVNHTNSPIFQNTTPANGSWWASLLWYYISKTAVPIFVMITGACLLPRRDSYRTHAARIVRMLIALILFSYLFFLYDAWYLYGHFAPYCFDFGAFVHRVWTATCGDAYWYLYFYIGLMLMLPLLQRMAESMSKGDRLYLMGMCFGVGAVWPLLTHYMPALASNRFWELSLFSIYIGLFFAGLHLHQSPLPTKKQLWLAGGTLVLSLFASIFMTRLEFDKVGPMAKYWFMDDRMHPSATTVISAMSMVILARGIFRIQLKPCTQRVLTYLSSCAFGIYLFEEVVIYLTRGPIYVPLCNHVPAIAAVLVWEAAVFAISLVLTLLCKWVPGFKKLL